MFIITKTDTMKKLILITILSVFFVFSGMSQKAVPDSLSGWKTGGVGSLNMTQVSLTNWAAGGESSLSGIALLNVYANYKKNKFVWDNTLDLAYGLLKQGDDPIIKSDDRIDFASKAGQYAFKNWYYTGLLGFKSQFAPGYSDPDDEFYISDFMSPAYLSVSLGMDYKPSDNFSLFISPLTGKMTFVMDDSLSNVGAFGVDPGSTFRPEFGGYIKMVFKYDVMENVSLQTKFDLFSNYIENPENIDVTWDVLVAMKVNDYLTATITTNLIYDDDIDITIENDDGTESLRPAVQFKEMFALGLSYKF
jgi:hypothetical protein